MHINELFSPEMLAAEIEAKHIRPNDHPTLPLRLYNYTEIAQYQKAWNDVTRACRVLIVHRETGEIVARPFQKFLNGRSLPDPRPREAAASEWTPYEPDRNLPPAYLVDIDGTVAIKGDRDIYDGSKAHLDTENEDVAAVVRALSNRGNRIIYMSGRSDEFRDVTERWLIDNALPADSLYMRAAGDHRKDSVVKHELFDKHIRYTHNVLGVFDDRNQVVEMWRAIGLTVFQVADGNF